MATGEFLEVRRRMVRDFSKRQKEYHTAEREQDLTKTSLQGDIQKDIQTALQNLRNKGMMELQQGEQAFQKPYQEAQIGEANARTKQATFDYDLGKVLAPELAGYAATDKMLMTNALRKQLGQDKTAKPYTPSYDFPNIPGLEQASEPTNVLRYHPLFMMGRAAKTGLRGLFGVGDFIRRRFRLGTDVFE